MAASWLGCCCTSMLALLALGVLLLPGPVRASAADTVAAGQPLTGAHKVVSQGGRFAMGFFQPDGGAGGRWYVGIWYHNISVQTPVWVANRGRPVSDPASSQLTVAPDGNPVLLDQSGSIVWSTNTSKASSDNDTVPVVVARLLDTGNLVLSNASAALMWQSFDHVGDTWIPGGKLRRDKRTGAAQRMVSWSARGDPAPGTYVLQLDPAGAPQFVLLWNGNGTGREYWASGNWTGQAFAGMPEGASLRGESRFSFRFVDTDRASYLAYSYADNATRFRFVMGASGQIQGWIWAGEGSGWALVYSDPKAHCSVPRGCGPFGVCSGEAAASSPCACAWGFSARSPASWALGDYTGGCVRNAQLQQQCGWNKDAFSLADGASYPDDARRVVAGDASASDCEVACLADCACSAYAYDGICFLWDGDLFNLRYGYGRLYVRLATSDLFPGANSHHHTRAVQIAVAGVVFSVIAVSLVILVVRARKRRRAATELGLRVTGAHGCVTTGFSYRDLQRLTNNFSHKIGGGAFGSVFKGQLLSVGVAVKKLEGLRQGEKQFRSEVSTLGTIQHVNLIHLLGFCSDRANNKLLVYEYMPNGSLDRHLFCASATSCVVLSWEARHRIALGVAKGLAYLHGSCRDCIIHCDVKPENILLDAAFGPKVADFGLAKLVGRDFSRVLTTARGTIGYLAPEWIGGEAVTAKADVYSYGMTLFEMVSGRRNVEHGDDDAWSSGSGADDCAASTTAFFPVVVAKRLHEPEGDVTTLLDPRLEGDVDADELRRVCKVSCWCIQHDMDARPTMAEVVQVLQGLANVEIPPVPRYLEAITCGKYDSTPLLFE